VIWALLYTGLLAALVLRFRDPAAPMPEPARPVPDEPLRLVAAHHILFYALLLGAPLEAAFAGGVAPARGTGAVLFGAGVLAYRLGGRALGDALSPFVEPRAGSALVTAGPYRWVRHPMYLGQAAIAVGAPLTLGCRWTLVVSAAALIVLAIRVALEEGALARTFPEYSLYAAKSKRFLPFLF
jgi:protein-S-isoprenylcysteine O-methyltransferase Ste14